MAKQKASKATTNTDNEAAFVAPLEGRLGTENTKELYKILGTNTYKPHERFEIAINLCGVLGQIDLSNDTIGRISANYLKNKLYNIAFEHSPPLAGFTYFGFP